jgi:hypothetical protein
MGIAPKHKREWTIVSDTMSDKLKEDANKSGRKSVSKQIAYILYIYYENKEKIDKLIK